MNGNHVIPELPKLQAMISTYSRTCIYFQIGTNLIITTTIIIDNNSNINNNNPCCSIFLYNFKHLHETSWQLLKPVVAYLDHPCAMENTSISEAILALGSSKHCVANQSNTKKLKDYFLNMLQSSLCLLSSAVLLGFFFFGHFTS